MSIIKVYNKEGKILFNKNKFFCFIYKYEKGKETMFSINMNENPSKFHSLFEYIIYLDNEEIRVSLTEDCVDYEIKIVDGVTEEIEKGRIPLKNRKRNWSKKTIKSENNDTLEIESFDGNKSVIYKLKDEIIENLIKINNGKNRRENRKEK
jgi:hypothetical protein